MRSSRVRTIFTLLTVIQFICAVLFCAALSVHNEGTVTQTVTMLAGVVMTCDAVMEAIVRCKGMTLGFRYILGACSRKNPFSPHHFMPLSDLLSVSL